MLRRVHTLPRNPDTSTAMNGAQALLQTLVAAHIEVCFTNPGTSEMHFVAALDRQDGMRGVPGLFEGVPGTRAQTCAQFADALARSIATPGPSLIEVVV